MSILEVFIIGIGLSMDAFAVSICKGLSLKKFDPQKAVIVGLYFGLFQGIMPLLGYLIGSQFAELVANFDHWIAFILLALIGGNMIKESRKEEDCPSPSFSPSSMLPLAVATSIDALAIGVSFAFLNVNIITAASLIAGTTFIISIIGVQLGSVFGSKFKSKAELAGGLILIIIGAKTLIQHLMGG